MSYTADYPKKIDVYTRESRLQNFPTVALAIFLNFLLVRAIQFPKVSKNWLKKKLCLKTVIEKTGVAESLYLKKSLILMTLFFCC